MCFFFNVFKEKTQFLNVIYWYCLHAVIQQYKRCEVAEAVTLAANLFNPLAVRCRAVVKGEIVIRRTCFAFSCAFCPFQAKKAAKDSEPIDLLLNARQIGDFRRTALTNGEGILDILHFLKAILRDLWCTIFVSKRTLYKSNWIVF